MTTTLDLDKLPALVDRVRTRRSPQDLQTWLQSEPQALDLVNDRKTFAAPATDEVIKLSVPILARGRRVRVHVTGAGAWVLCGFLRAQLGPDLRTANIPFAAAGQGGAIPAAWEAVALTLPWERELNVTAKTVSLDVNQMTLGTGALKIALSVESDVPLLHAP